MSTTESPQHRSRLGRIARALFSRRAWYVYLSLITLVALFYAEENFRGRRAWDRYRKDAEQRGVNLDFKKSVPPPVPEDLNGANTPFIQGWFITGTNAGTNPLSQLASNLWPERFGRANSMVVFPNKLGRGDDRQMTDLVAWQRALAATREPKSKEYLRFTNAVPRDPAAQPAAARAVLEELKSYQAALDELRLAARKPQIRYPVVYDEENPFLIRLPHLAKIKSVVTELRVQASAELAAGEVDRAFEDVRLMLWLCDSLERDTFLIGQLVRVACQALALQPIWEGLVEHKWSESQLKELQERLLRLNYAASMDLAMDAERTGGITYMLNIIRRNNLDEALAQLDPALPGEAEAGTAQPKRFVASMVPRGWLYMELVNHSRMFDLMVAQGWNSEAKVFHPATLTRNHKQFESTLQHGLAALWHHHVLAGLLLPALERAADRFARGQAAANQGALACALERYRLSKGAYPEALTSLVPEFIAVIPNEAVSTNAMRYRRTDGGYVLHSAGWDGKDDGGAPLVPAKQGKGDLGDWVWRVPAAN